MRDVMDYQPRYGRACELVAISEAETLEPERVAKRGWPVIFFERIPKCHDWKVYPRNCQRASFYNVMWIKWVGDVAERRGLGVVQKESWDALQSEIKEFNLG
jgi:hypothetical protein